MNPLITAADFDLSKGQPCISAAQKFVIPVPAFKDGGEPLVFPAGHEKAGEPITDWQGKPIGERGLVFYNDTDKVVQAARGDGQAIVIINQVTAAQAKELVEEIKSMGSDPSEFSLAQVKEELGFARALGLGDQYNSDQAFMKAKFTPVDDRGGYGLFKRDDRDLCKAFIMDTVGSFAGPAAEPQPFVPGDVIVAQPDGKGGHSFRKVEGETFKKTYTSPSGLPMGMAQNAEDGLGMIAHRRSGEPENGSSAKPAAPKPV